jgi:hypothetical protein
MVEGPCVAGRRFTAGEPRPSAAKVHCPPPPRPAQSCLPPALPNAGCPLRNLKPSHPQDLPWVLPEGVEAVLPTRSLPTPNTPAPTPHPTPAPPHPNTPAHSAPPQDHPWVLLEDVEAALPRLHELWPGLDEDALANSHPAHLALALRALSQQGPPARY